MSKLATNPKNIIIVVFRHPIDRAQVEMIELPFRCQTTGGLKQQFMPGQDAVCIVDGVVDGMVKEGSEVAVVPTTAGGVVGAVIDLIVKYVFSWTFVAAVAISVGLSYLGGMLFGSSFEQPRLSRERDEERSQSFGWNPHTTQREGIPKPLCYGANMHMGNIIARWTDVDESGSEVLYMILDYGRGPIQGRVGNTVYFNDQPEGNYPGVTIQDRAGTLGQSCMTGFEKNKLEYRPDWQIDNTGDLAGPVKFVTPNKYFDDLEYTVVFPRGLFHYKNDGTREQHGVGVKVEISERDAGSWTTLMDTTINGNQMSPVYKAYKVSEQGFSCQHDKQYDLRYRKTTEDKDPGKYGDIFSLRSVREVYDVAFTYPGRALLGIKALATNRLSGHLDVKWKANGKLVNVYGGGGWNIEFSRNRAWIVLDILTQPIISGSGVAEDPWTIERYEGLNPNSVDLALFYEWAQYCDVLVPSGDGEKTEARMTCDLIVDWQTDIWSLAHELSQVGRMSPYWQGTVLTGWIDKAVDDYIDLVTFDNVMLRSWKNMWMGYGEIAGAVEVHYKDALEGYERKTLPIPNEDAGLYTRVVSVEGTGISSRSLATRVGTHVLARNKLIKNVNSVRMYKDALRYRVGQAVRLQATVPNWGQAYRVIEAIADDTVELDRVVEEVAENDIIFVRAYDEVAKEVTLKSYTVDSIGGGGKAIVIKETWEVTPIKDNIVAIGVAGAIKKRRIIKMTHAPDNYFDVVLETYDIDLFANDDATPTIPNPDYEWVQPTPPSLVPSAIKSEVMELVERVIPPSPDIDMPWMSNCNWTGNEVDTIYWAKRDASEPILFRYRGVTYEITPDNTTDEFVYWDPNYTTVFKTTNVAGVALAAGNWLVCTNKDGVPHPCVPIPLLHGAIIQTGTITAEYGQIAALAVKTLNIQDHAVTVPVTAYTEGIITQVLPGGNQASTIIEEASITVSGQLINITIATEIKAGTGATWQACAVARERRADAQNITNITQASQAIVTCAGHGYEIGDYVRLYDVEGMTEINSLRCQVLSVTTNTFTLNVDSTGFGAYTGDGKVVESIKVLPGVGVSPDVGSWRVFAFSKGDSPSAGTYNYTFSMNSDSTNGTQARTRSILLLEAKK